MQKLGHQVQQLDCHPLKCINDIPNMNLQHDKLLKRERMACLTTLPALDIATADS